MHSRFVLLQELDRLGYNEHVQRGWRSTMDTVRYQKKDENTEISRYDPLDLFSLEKDRIRQSLSSVWACPQNNFKLWYTPSANDAECSGLQQPELIIADEHYLSSEAKSFGSNEFHWQTVLPRLFAKETGGEHCSCQNDPGVYKDVLLTVITDILYTESDLLEKILQWQQFDILDGDGAVALYQRLVELCQGSHEEAQQLLDQCSEPTKPREDAVHFLQSSPFNLHGIEATCQAYQALHAEINRFSSQLRRFPRGQPRLDFLREEHESSRRACLQHLSHIRSKRVCCFLLQNWLLSLALCDVSFFVTLQMVQANHTLFLESTASSSGALSPDLSPAATTRILRRQTGDLPGIIQAHLRPDTIPIAFEYEVKVIDCDKKPAKKLQSREKKEVVFQFPLPEERISPAAV
jgi:inositol-pentakisphosphate 2-kinase